MYYGASMIFASDVLHIRILIQTHILAAVVQLFRVLINRISWAPLF